MNIALSVDDVQQLEFEVVFPEERADEEATDGDKAGIGHNALENTYVDFIARPYSQLRFLISGDEKNFRRVTSAFAAKLGLTILLVMLIGIIYINVGAVDPRIPFDIQSRFEAFIIVCLLLAIGMFSRTRGANCSSPQMNNTDFDNYGEAGAVGTRADPTAGNPAGSYHI